MEKELVWHRAANITGEKMLAQHAFKPKERGKWYQYKYQGNESLCGKVGIVNENNVYIPVDEIEDEELDTEKACKSCLRIAEKILDGQEK